MKKIGFMTQKWIHTVKESLAISQCIARERNPHDSSCTETAGLAPAGPLMSNITADDGVDFIFFLFQFAIRDSFCLLVPAICQRCVSDKSVRRFGVRGLTLIKVVEDVRKKKF